MKKLPLLILLLMSGICGLLRGQSFDLTTGRVPVASLDGLWRFHTGDNPAWADPSFDDSQWTLLLSDKPWSNLGYKDYGGMAWYRFQVTVPAGLNHVSLYLPQIRTSYEIYADGRLIETYAAMPPNTLPYGGGGDFRAYPLPLPHHSDGKIEIALRIWHWPRWAFYRGGGPQHGGGLVGDTQLIAQQNDLDRARTFRSSASSETLVMLESLAGLGALVLFILRRKESEYLWFSLMMLSAAAWIGIDLSQSTVVWSIELRDLGQQVALSVANLASIAFYRQLLHPRRTWLLKLAVAAVALNMLNIVVASLSGSTLGVWFEDLVGDLCELVVNAWIVGVVFIRAKQNSADARLLAAPVALGALVGLVYGVADTSYRLGWQHKFDTSITLFERPFPITLGNLTDALFLLAVFGILILRFTRTRGQEERFAAEVQSARNVQQYLIPEQLPPTPGFTIESEYRPAREVGGDFFQVLPNPVDGSVLIVLGDVAGKGMQAGMLATLIVGASRTAAEFTTDPEKILALLNKRLQNRGLVTCLALKIEPDGHATLVNAGHLPPYLNGRELEIEGSLPLGAVVEIDFPVLRIQLAEGDTLMLMSDGIAEAQDADGHLFGFDRIIEMLNRRATAAELATAAQVFGQEDDVTVLSVARLAPAMIG